MPETIETEGQPSVDRPDDVEALGRERHRAGDYPTVTPQQAWEQLRATGKLTGVRVSHLQFSGEIVHGIELNDVILDRPQFHKAVFKAAVRFFRCTINGAKFHRQTRFEQQFLLKACQLRRLSRMELNCRGGLSLDTCQVHGPLTLVDSELSSIRLWASEFDNWLEFKRCTFTGPADMRSFQANQGVIFGGCHFQQDVLLRGASIIKKLDFADAKIDQLVDLSKAKLSDYVYLEQIQMSPQTTFCFQNAVADRILINSGQLDGRMQSERAAQYTQAMEEYGLLKAVFQSLHRFDEEDWAFYRFKVNRRRSRSRSWWRPWSKLGQLCDLLFLDFGCGYGTRPSRAILSSLSVIVLFALIYASGIEHFKVDHPPLPGDPLSTIPNRVLFGLITSVSVFTSGFGGNPLESSHGWMLIPLTLEALVGTFLWGLFVVAYSRKVIR